MPRAPKIFFVSHPHIEPRIKSGSIGFRQFVPWNTGILGCSGHCRKFIRRGGTYLDNKALMRDTLLFWGEYEPPSEATIIRVNKPIAVHDPLFPVRGLPSSIPVNALNTDPYVFGNHFKYICCKIGRKKFVAGDMILFGHYYHPNRFDLDTVIIIDKAVKIDYSLNCTQYFNAAVGPMSKRPSIYYQGVSYSPKTKYYSFVPCLQSEQINSIPPLPNIDLTRMGFSIKKGWRSYVAAGIPFTDSNWSYVVNAVKKSGWSLGVKIDKI